jgi:acetyltransferase-like isoleucine patch superfamily enzyme
MADASGARISPTASVSPEAVVGIGTMIWDLTQIREKASIGDHCVVGRGAYIDHDVTIGDNCKIQNEAQIYYPARIGDGVFIGPGVILTNDLHPRAVNPDMSPKGDSDWSPTRVTIEDGASIGAGSIVVGEVRIGAWALVGAGSIVTRDVPAHALVTGSPAQRVGWVGRGGRRMLESGGLWYDPDSGERFRQMDDELVVADD